MDSRSMRRSLVFVGAVEGDNLTFGFRDDLARDDDEVVVLRATSQSR